ncbi:MAG: MotA/TolQ/ExbB proton channel family protein [Methanobrevibacter boviskoreani]|jgi:biopolymer transport protein ExbB|uniref:MotA/TolQ/ExbB proton channel family protein n=1 Tax=Methanobrevibacter TaxID=2172 RepID=UPI0003348BDA|nr:MULTISPECIES: MotA/TolQ/ExbB proton channel family protein [Methanobrevibacter]AGN17362.1 transporter MotA/TolQ/ExbB proton channel family [Methanobrevibacter sp. AbM4]MDD6256756.1 MotA/TolQ/ExbB proton channel family protein [Methanobrevibacter boviskoreani]
MIIEAITGLISGFVDFFQQGGIITYIITFIGIWGFITSLQKVNYLRKISDIDATEIMGVVSVAMERGGAIEALKEISPYKNPVSRIISEALKIGYKNKTEVEESMEQIFIVETSKMTKGLDTIKTIIELAPFLGLIGTVIGIWMTFGSLGVNPDPTAMARGIYTALITTIAGLTVAIVLTPLYTYIKILIEREMDKIELATKMTNWNYAVAKIRVTENLPCVIQSLQEGEGIVNVREISEPDANIQISFKPSMLEKSISNIILEMCNVGSEIVESKLKQ